MTQAFDAAEKAFGTVTILVNNAGVVHAGRAVDMSEEEWRRVLSTNLDAVFYWAQEAARRMLAAGTGGAIVNIASVLGLGVDKGVIAYATAKAGVIQMTKALALELAFKGIRVNAIAPGWIITEINALICKASAVRRSSATFRWGVSAKRAISTAHCCCWFPMPAATSPAPPSLPTAARSWRCAADRGDGIPRDRHRLCRCVRGRHRQWAYRLRHCDHCARHLALCDTADRRRDACDHLLDRVAAPNAADDLALDPLGACYCIRGARRVRRADRHLYFCRMSIQRCSRSASAFF